MYVYIWKDAAGIPFYVGMGQTLGRTSPKTKHHRNKACLHKLAEIGTDSVTVEIRTTPTPEAAKNLEQALIAQYGRVKDGTGTLTNISKGGEYHVVSPETRTILRENWLSDEHKEKVKKARVGKTRVLAESTKEALRIRLANNPKMQHWGERNGKDPEFDAKRIKGIRAAQDKRREKMSDPVALAKRKAKLKATMSSPEYLAKRVERNTPEHRAKLSAAKKEYWAKRKAVS